MLWPELLESSKKLSATMQQHTERRRIIVSMTYELFSSVLLFLAGAGLITFNRFCAEEGLRNWINMFWRPTVLQARVLVVFVGIVTIFLGLAVLSRTIPD